MNIEILKNTREIHNLIRSHDFSGVLNFDKPFLHAMKCPIANRLIDAFSEDEVIEIIERHQLETAHPYSHTLFKAIAKNKQKICNYIIDKTTDFSFVMHSTDAGEKYDNSNITLLSYACNVDCDVRWLKILDNTPTEFLHKKCAIIYYSGDHGGDNAAHRIAYVEPVNYYRLQTLYDRGVDFSVKEAYDDNTPIMHILDNDMNGLAEFISDKMHLLDEAMSEYQKTIEYLEKEHPGHDQLHIYRDKMAKAEALQEVISLASVGNKTSSVKVKKL